MTEERAGLDVQKVTVNTKLGIIITVIATGALIYHLLSTQYFLFDIMRHQNVHLALVLTLTFLFTLQEKRGKRRWFLLSVLLIILSLVTTGYMFISYEAILLRTVLPTLSDVLIGIILIILVLEATRQAFGMILPSLCLLFLLYTAFGFLLPPPLEVLQFSPDTLSVMEFKSQSDILGQPL